MNVLLVIVGTSGLSGAGFSFGVLGTTRDWRVKTVALVSAANNLILVAGVVKELM